MTLNKFQQLITKSSEAHASNIVLALDYVLNDHKELLRTSLNTIQDLSSHICALKINYHLVLPLGLYYHIKKVVNTAHMMGLPVIMDCKINDIGNTNFEIARHYFAVGFDALTANPLVGWKEGLEPVFKLARDLGRGVILLVYMSHKGAKEGYGQLVYDEEKKGKIAQYVSFAKKALNWGADGAVVGATVPEKITEIHEILEDKIPIYSPGIGIQGGKAVSAFNAGASYLIVGRSITLAENPKEIARILNEKLKIN